MLCGQVGKKPEVKNSRWRPLKWSYLYLSLYRHDNNAISTAKPMFSGINNPTELLCVLRRSIVSNKYKKDSENTFVLIHDHLIIGLLLGYKMYTVRNCLIADEITLRISGRITSGLCSPFTQPTTFM